MTEVFRLTPVVGNYYETVMATSKVWNSRITNWQYYTTNPYRYLGKFVRSESRGLGDGSTYWEIYEKDGVELILEYDYEGMTCLRQCDCTS